MLKRLWQRWWTGLLVLIPVTVTFYLLWQLLAALEWVGQDLIAPLGISHIPGLSLLTLLLIILAAGAFVTHYLGHQLVTWAESTMESIPLVRSIYLTLKGMTDLFNFRSRFGHSAVVMFPFPRDGTWALGLVMGAAPTAITQATGAQLLMVFVPTAIHPFTGYLAFIPTHTATRLALPIEEVMKMQFSAGLYRPTRAWLNPSEPAAKGDPIA